jgi:hypothetical protein
MHEDESAVCVLCVTVMPTYLLTGAHASITQQPPHIILTEN